MENEMESEMGRDRTANETALDLLEREDVELGSVFSRIRSTRGETVEGRSDYGDLAKTAIRHVATREAALVDVANVAAGVPELEGLNERLERHCSVRRQALDRVEKMSRGVQGINLNTGQDFAEEFSALMQIVSSEIDWDLREAIPSVRKALEQRDMVGDLTSADKVAKRAPTNLSPQGPRWFEHAPVISRLLSIYDRLRDFPRAARRYQ